ncbi:hypothetical protein E1258_25375, partial [Micromonospora sp. KC207]|uniref:hypothetical protein n=1 Tax=Micromonospora sp. KC207 TaxID=2530377 RepID=UPI00104830A7
MAFRTWGKLLLTALGVSVLAGAGQLGVAHGFGIVRIAGDFTDATVNRWPAQLVWVGWCAALAAVVGAVVTERLARAHPLTRTATGQLALAGAAALGAMVVAPLCMQPARATQLNSVDPVWAVGICAALGALVGAGAALAVLLRLPLGWNVAAVAGTIWFVALLSALPALAGTGPLPTVRLGVFEPGWLGADTAQRLAPLVLPLVALLAGAASGALARWHGHPPLTSGATGAAGPVLVAFAYLAAGPGDSADRYQLAPYYGALIAVVTGVLGSTAAALARWPLFPRSDEAEAGGDLPGTLGSTASGAPGAGLPGTLGSGLPGAQVAGKQPAIVPTDILRPLPTGPTPPGAGGPADPDARPDAATARRVPATVGDPLPDDRTGDGRDHVGAGAPAGGPPAHWEWPMASGTTAARPIGAVETGGATDATATGGATTTIEAGGPTGAGGVARAGDVNFPDDAATTAGALAADGGGPTGPAAVAEAAGTLDPAGSTTEAPTPARTKATGATGATEKTAAADATTAPDAPDRVAPTAAPSPGRPGPLPSDATQPVGDVTQPDGPTSAPAGGPAWDWSLPPAPDGQPNAGTAPRPRPRLP